MTLQESVDIITEAWKAVAKQLEKLLGKLAEELRKSLEKIEEHKRLLRRPPKWHIKANNPIMITGRIRIFHCRNNC